jgi:hypothetical protein
MNIYGLYVENGNRAGFWVQHRSWRNTCVQVLSIAGRRSGALPGRAPNRNHADVLVRCFDVRSGRPVPFNSLLDSPADRRYSKIAEPPWYRPHQPRLAERMPTTA